LGGVAEYGEGVFVVLTEFLTCFSIVLQHVLEIPNVFLNMFPVVLTLSHILCPRSYNLGTNITSPKLMMPITKEKILNFKVPNN
jgi:hypothetical protein